MAACYTLRLGDVSLSLEFLREPSKKILGKLYPKIGQCINTAIGLRKMGMKDYFALRSLSDSETKYPETLVSVKIPSLRHPIFVRRATSDAAELIHSAVREVYKKYLPLGPVKCIIDAGANMGDTTVWYLSRFPEAKVVSIEPDKRNFELLKKNCRPYGNRSIPLLAGLWPSNSKLLVQDYGSYSGLTVKEVTDGPFDCEGITPLSILRAAREEIIDIFKCDIEGAELQLFQRDCDKWLSRTRSLYIELHNEEAKMAVMTAMNRHPFRCRAYREIHIFSRIGPI